MDQWHANHEAERLALCAVFDTFDVPALVAILGIQSSAAKQLVQSEMVEQADEQRIYRIKPRAVHALLEQLRANHAPDELTLHSRAFHYFLSQLQQPHSLVRTVERACFHHLRALRDLLLEHMRRAEAAEVVASFRAVATDLEPEHAAQLTLYDAYDAMRLHEYERSNAVIQVLLQQSSLDPTLHAEAYMVRGLGSLNQSRWERARADFEVAFVAGEAANNHVMQGLALINQATILHQLNQFERALETCQRSLVHFETAGDTYNAAFARYCIGNNALYLGQWQFGLTQLDLAAAAYGRANMVARLAMVDWARGFFNQILGDTTASELAYGRVLQVATSRPYTDHVLAADTLMHLGLIHHVRHERNRAEQCYTQAIALAETLHDDYRRALLLHHYGRLHATTDSNMARHVLATAIECLELLRISTRSDESKIDLLGTAQHVYETMVLEQIACGEDAQAFEYVERARTRAFLDLVAQRGGIENHMVAPPVVTLQTLQSLLSPDALVLEYFTIGVIPATNTFLAQLAEHNEPLAQQLLSPPSIVLFAVTAHSFELHHLPMDPNLLVPVADGHTTPRIPLTERKLSWLYNQLIAPAAHLFAQARVVHVVPHGPLHALPFAALHQPNGMPLLEANGPAIVYAPSASVLATCLTQQPVTNGQTLVLGYNDQGTTALALAEHEARVVGQKLGARVLAGTGEKSATLFDAGPRLRLLHIAGHAIFAANDPMGSFLRLGPSDEVDARTLMEHLHLQAATVVLNACMSGVSRIAVGDEFLGLPRAFLYAGAATIVCTQHAVDDLAAALLMAFFYDFLAHAFSPAQAMQQAQITLRSLRQGEVEQVLNRLFGGGEFSTLPPFDRHSEYPFAHQRYWSPFIVIGKA